MSTLAMNPGHSRISAARPRRRQSTSVRLTRRGRVVVVLLLVALLLALFTVFGPRSAATREAGTPVQTRTVEVGPGDTLWGIAAEVAEPGEVRESVHQIQELNALTGPGLVVGQEIAVPVG
jgi:hypothetical protein